MQIQSIVDSPEQDEINENGTVQSMLLATGSQP